MDVKSFKKSTLFNLVETAESISPACQSLVFITARGKSGEPVSENYQGYKDLFQVIGAKRMVKKGIAQIADSDDPKEFGQILENYGFYKMEIWDICKWNKRNPYQEVRNILAMKSDHRSKN